MEEIIKSLATIFGVIALSAPILAVLRQVRRPKGRSSGKAAGTRNWLGVLVMTMGLVGIGTWLWIPIPFLRYKLWESLLSFFGTVTYFPGIGLYLWGLATLHSQFGVSGLLGAELYRDHKLITSGPFLIIRHPMYLGALMAAFGALLIFRTWAMVLFMPMSLVVIVRAEREEKLLEKEFGDDWHTYSSKVPKWFPRL